MPDAITQFQNVMQADGFCPAEIIKDGKPHRFDISKKGDHKGYYQLFTDGVAFGLYGSWAAQEPGAWFKWSAKPDNSMTDAEREENRKRWKKAQIERRKQLAAAHLIAATEAQRIWDSSTAASDDNPYLKRKKVKPYDIRMDGADLIIPVRINGNITSIQRIKPDGTKLFQTGGEISGGYHSIDGDMSRIYIAEGYATGASIRDATGCQVVVAFNAGNLKAVAKAIRAKLPDVEIVIAGDTDKSGTGQRKGNASATAVGGKVVLPDFADSESGSDWNDYAAIHGIDAVRDEIGRLLEAPATEKQEPASKPEKVKAPSQASTLVAIAQNQQGHSGAELFHDPSGKAYVTVDVSGVLKTLPVRCKDYRNMLRRDLYNQDGRNASAQAIDDALGTLEGQALFDGRECDVHLRVAGNVDSAIYIDLGNEAWQSVRITPEGWKVDSSADVKWRRPPGMRPLPVPVKGGSWRKLFDIFPLPENEQVLVIAWLLMTLNPNGPYPLIILQGEQGTGKSTLSKLLRGLIDPNLALIRTTPRNEHDLVIAAQNGWVIALDNLSGMQPWLSDGLCRLATGGGFAARELYSNGDEHIIEATRPIIINGIDDMAARPDLADRAIILNLEHIDKSKVRTEKELVRAYEAECPGIMGSLLDAVSMAMRMLPQTHLAELPRMADFALWVTAAESALWKQGTFIQTYNNARQEVVAAGLDGSPVAQAITSMMFSREQWEGTATALLDALNIQIDDKTSRLKIWPKTARGLSNVVRRLAPSLRADGLDISFRHDKRRLITIRKDNSCNSASVPSASSETLQDKGYSADATPTQNNVPTQSTDAADASENLSTAKKAIYSNDTDAADANDAKKQTLSCRGESGAGKWAVTI